MKLKTLNLDGYEARVIGIDRYKEIAHRHNLFTKKWTYGRLKEFTIDVNKEMETKLKHKKSILRKIFKKRRRLL